MPRIYAWHDEEEGKGDNPECNEYTHLHVILSYWRLQWFVCGRERLSA